jgi:hypothetical protein
LRSELTSDESLLTKGVLVVLYFCIKTPNTPLKIQNHQREQKTQTKRKRDQKKGFAVVGLITLSLTPSYCHRDHIAAFQDVQPIFSYPCDTLLQHNKLIVGAVAMRPLMLM